MIGQTGDQLQGLARQMYWPAPFYTQPATFMPFPLYPSLVFVLPCSPSLCVSPQGFAQVYQILHPSQYGVPMVCNLNSCKVQVNLSWSCTCSFLTAHQLVWLARFVSSHSLHHCLSVLYLSMFVAFTFSYQPDFMCSSIRSSCWNKHSHTPLSLPISATNQVCFWLLTSLSLVSQVFCVSVFGFSLSSHLTGSSIR